MKKAGLLFIMLLTIVLAACSSTKAGQQAEVRSPISSPTSNRGVLDSIQVSQYVSGTTRTQPELINEYYEQADVTVLEEWLAAAGTPGALPEGKDISKIKKVDYFYAIEGQPLTSEGYMYITFMDGSGYSKRIEQPGSMLDVYPYEASSNPSLIQAMGVENWRPMGVQALL